MNQEHERLKMNVRLFTECLINYKPLSTHTKDILGILMDSDMFKDMVELSKEPIEDVGELDTEVKPDKPESEVNNER